MGSRRRAKGGGSRSLTPLRICPTMCCSHESAHSPRPSVAVSSPRTLATGAIGDTSRVGHLSAPGIGLTSSATTESFATSNVTAFSRSSGSDSAPCTATEFLLRSRRSERAVAGGRQSTALPTYPRDFHPAWDQTLRSMRFRSRSGIRFVMQLNARAAFHLLELRTAVGGHPDYRRVCQEMHRLIREQAGHAVIADAMRFVDHSGSTLGRLDSERKAEARRGAGGLHRPGSSQDAGCRFRIPETGCRRPRERVVALLPIAHRR